MKFKPHKYQQLAIDHILDNTDVLLCKGAGLILEMGLGKTVSCLTAADILMYDRMEVKKTLVIAPKRVAEHTWAAEINKWDHLRHLRCVVVAGDANERKALLKQEGDIFCISRDLVPWLIGVLEGEWHYEMVIIDELSGYKNPKSQRFKTLRLIRPLVKRVVGLTGTFSPNGLLDIWSQMYLLDRGARLGKTLKEYRDKYFKEGRRNGMIVYDYKLQKEADDLIGEDINETEIYGKISDICISMKTRDWLDLPDRLDTDLIIDLPEKAMSEYLDFERTAVLEAYDPVTGGISAVNAAALTNKLLQYSNGAVYREDRTFKEVHDEKIQALIECVEATEGSPLLVFYSFKHDLARILESLKKFKPEVLGGANDIIRWNKGKIPILCAHPASAGHGLNLQEGGNHIAWFGLPWSSELYLQAVARLDRQGQPKSVINTRIICAGTMDEDVVRGLNKKILGQNELMEAIKVRVDRWINT